MGNAQFKPLSPWERGWGEGLTLTVFECALRRPSLRGATRLCAETPSPPTPLPKGRGECE